MAKSNYLSYSQEERQFRKSNNRQIIRKIIFSLLLVLVIAVCISEVAGQNREFNRLRLEEKALQEKLERVEAEGQRIKDLKDSYGTDKFVERIARDELGLITKDEYIFVED